MGVLRFDSYDFHPTAVLDSHPDGILVIDHAGVVRYANPAAAAAFDTVLDSMLGRQFSVPLDDKRVLEIKAPSGRLLRLRCVPTLWASRPARLVCLSDGRVKLPEPVVRPVSRTEDELTVESLADQLDMLHESLESLHRSAGSLGDRLRASPVLLVQQAADTLADHAAALDALAPSEQVARLPDLLDDLARELNRDNATALETADQLQKTLGKLRAGLSGLRRRTTRSDETPTPLAAVPRTATPQSATPRAPRARTATQGD